MTKCYDRDGRRSLRSLVLPVLIVVLATVGGGLANIPQTARGAGEPSLTLFPPVVGAKGVLINGVTLPGSAGTTIVRIHWDWGDGAAEDSFFPGFHAYERPGTYTIVATSYQSDRLTTMASVSVQFRALAFKTVAQLLSFDENDIALTSVAIIGTNAGRMDYRFRVTNLGSTPVSLDATWTVAAWLSVDPVLDRVLDTAIGSRPLGPPRSLAVGAFFEDAFFGEIPGGSLAGFFYLIVEVQSHGTLQEANYGNNHLILRLGRAPIVRANWHLPASYTRDQPSSFLVEVCNGGGDATLTTSGNFGGFDTGTGEYFLPSGECVGLGYGDDGPVITSQYIQSGQVCIFHTSTLMNAAGTSSYSDTRCVPVVSDP